MIRNPLNSACLSLVIFLVCGAFALGCEINDGEECGSGEVWGEDVQAEMETALASRKALCGDKWMDPFDEDSTWTWEWCYYEEGKDFCLNWLNTAPCDTEEFVYIEGKCNISRIGVF